MPGSERMITASGCCSKPSVSGLEVGDLVVVATDQVHVRRGDPSVGGLEDGSLVELLLA
jgi:hypothetical protein